MLEYSYSSLPWQIVFGVDALDRLPEEMDQRGLSHALVLTTADQAESGHNLLQSLAHRGVGLFSDAAMHVPDDTLRAATKKAKALGARCTVALGGGSTTGLGKALSVNEGLANVVVPTTYAGSEMTDIWAVTADGRKVTARDVRAVPNLTIYDPRLTLTLPPKFAAASGMNAMAQAVVNVATHKPNPMVRALALEAIRALAASLPRIIADGADLDARAAALHGASLAGAALGTGSTGLHHRLCHTFGGTFNTSHAQTHSVLLPYVVAFNRDAIVEATDSVAQALGSNSAAEGLQQLARSLGAPSTLKELNVRQEDLEQAVAVTLEAPIDNARPVDAHALSNLLQHAFTGDLADL